MEVCKKAWEVSIMEGLLLKIAHKKQFDQTGWQWCWWHRGVVDFKLMMICGCWWHILNVGVQHFVSNIHHEHRCNLKVSGNDYSYVGDKVILVTLWWWQVYDRMLMLDTIFVSWFKISYFLSQFLNFIQTLHLQMMPFYQLHFWHRFWKLVEQLNLPSPILPIVVLPPVLHSWPVDIHSAMVWDPRLWPKPCRLALT